MLVEWRVYKWVNLLQMYLMELILIALENPSVYVPVYAPSISLQ